ncbi:MAG: shikimate kinase [Planctomycetota bacterium]|nr:MAG: shikimate kinase [Planctomycetota bacterium]REK26684.1 MAG: shikimate kinase [Planctomycetota bacterium]REK35657.1 MAG: shikimate kinase [Planctomycetota bacterium]
MVVTLIGYRGTGKSVVAQELAAMLGWSVVDADDEIERRVGRTIREIFDIDGESEFRRLERDVMRELLTRESTVVAAGGGAILNDETLADAVRAGEIVWLTASVDTILRRLESDAATRSRRPALTDHDQRAEVEQVLTARTPRYQAAATITVATDDRSPAEIAEEIRAQLGAAGEQGR